MHFYDTPWITHEGGCIFSLDFHPNGKKLATAGQDPSGAGLLVVWDIEFLSAAFDPASDTSPPQCNQNPLARVPHTSSINCVRWSKHATGLGRLVCAGDDSVICVYECVGVYSSMGSIDQHPPDPKRARRNVESYRCIHKLFGHSIDVLHIDWSPDGKFLASCSLDNTVIVWNALKLPEKVATLKQLDGGHEAGVKGLSWDPVGRFLATQSADNTLKIWQTDTWKCIQTFSEPFQESTNSTLFCRMDWSPEGSYLIAPCSMNNGGPTAKIFIRKDWSCERDFVGFRKAVSCVRANPACFQRTNSVGTHTTVSCFAVGSRDRSLSVWLVPNFGRPLLVLDKLFKLSVVDLSWNGLTLAACSRDGAIRLLKFSDGELGHMLSAHETGLIMERVYGLRPHFLLPDESRKSGSGISADFGYTSICDALTKRAKETTMSPREINRIAFNRELPEKKVPVEVFERIAQKARNSMRNFNLSSENKTKTPVEKQPMQKFEQKQIDSRNGRDDAPLYGRSRAELSSNDTESVLFDLPPLKRLLFTEFNDPKHKSTSNYVEVINDCFEVSTEVSLSRLTAYRCTRGHNARSWEFFPPHLVSLLAVNSCWTVFASFDAHFTVLSTSTGRLLFELCLDEPLAILELNQNLCLTIGIAGTFSLWNVLTGRLLARHSLKELLYENPHRRLIATSISQKQADTDFFVGLRFSDLCTFVYSPELQRWNRTHTMMDLLDQIPQSITSMVLQNPGSTTSH